MRKLAVILGLVESCGLVIYSVGVALSHTHGATNVGGKVHLIQAAIYLVFALIIGLVSLGIYRDMDLARTPYYLFQIFVLIASQLLISSTNHLVSSVGIGIFVLAISCMTVMFLDGRNRRTH